MTRLKLFVLLNSLLLCSPVMSNSNTSVSKQNLTICSESGFPPFEMKDDSGQWKGFDIDIIQKFAQESNLNLIMLDISLDGLIPALTTKKCDLIVSGLTVTEERSQVVLFTKPVYSVTVTAAFLDSEESRNRFKSFSDMDKKGIKIASQTGSAASLYLKKTISQASLMFYSSENDEVSAILQKKTHVFVDDNVFISHVEKKLNRKFYQLPLSERGDIAFAARKEDTELVHKLNVFIEKIKLSGEYEGIVKKYF
ncbi:MAG: transporter substrate-binding domain-containing protein [Bdellovibrionota bacterium]